MHLYTDKQVGQLFGYLSAIKDEAGKAENYIDLEKVETMASEVLAILLRGDEIKVTVKK